MWADIIKIVAPSVIKTLTGGGDKGQQQSTKPFSFQFQKRSGSLLEKPTQTQQAVVTGGDQLEQLINVYFEQIKSMKDIG